MEKKGRKKKRAKRLTLLLGICQTHAAELMFTRAARWAIQHGTRLAWKNHGKADSCRSVGLSGMTLDKDSLYTVYTSDLFQLFYIGFHIIPYVRTFDSSFGFLIRELKPDNYGNTLQ